MRKPRVSLSVVASRLRQIQQAEDFAFEEARAFGAPSECNGLISRSIARDVVRVLRESGYTADSFDRELEARTTKHFAYFSGLVDTAHMPDEYWGRDARRFRP